MFKTRLPIVALVAALVLTGCGAPTAGLVSAPKLGKSAPAPSVSVVAAPGVTVTRGEEVSRQHVPALASTLKVTETAEMTDDEVAEDAVAGGYQVMAESKMGTKFGKTGYVRRTEAGFSFETTEGFFKKTTTVYTLNEPAKLEEGMAPLVNKKAFITGTLYADNSVDVFSSKKSLDLSSLFNWFTKGRVAGVVKNDVSEPVADVKVTVKSTSGFVYSTTTDAKGEFVVKNLAAGTYSVSVAKDGYDDVSVSSVEVTKRHRVNLQSTLEHLPAEPAPAPDATGTP